jgi:hypothetical protein
MLHKEGKMDRDENIRIARTWMTRNAVTLQQRLDPIDSAGVLLGAACGIVEAAHGRQTLVDFLLNIAANFQAKGSQPSDAV